MHPRYSLIFKPFGYKPNCADMWKLLIKCYPPLWKRVTELKLGLIKSHIDVHGNFFGSS